MYPRFKSWKTFLFGKRAILKYHCNLMHSPKTCSYRSIWIIVLWSAYLLFQSTNLYANLWFELWKKVTLQWVFLMWQKVPCLVGKALFLEEANSIFTVIECIAISHKHIPVPETLVRNINPAQKKTGITKQTIFQFPIQSRQSTLSHL